MLASSSFLFKSLNCYIAFMLDYMESEMDMRKQNIWKCENDFFKKN